jgi:hypothetical protein
MGSGRSELGFGIPRANSSKARSLRFTDSEPWIRRVSRGNSGTLEGVLITIIHGRQLKGTR